MLLFHLTITATILLTSQGRSFCGLVINELNTDVPGIDKTGQFIELRATCSRRSHVDCSTNGKDLTHYYLLVLNGKKTANGYYVSMFADLKDEKTDENSLYVLGNVPGANMDPNNLKFHFSGKYLRLSMRQSTESIFPDGDKYANAAILVYDKADRLHELGSLIQRRLPLTDNHLHIIHFNIVDMVLYSRQGQYTRCSLFEWLPPLSTYQSVSVLREYDWSTFPDLSLNYCIEMDRPLFPFSPERFKLGTPTPGTENDCSGSQWHLESILNQYNAESDEGCSTNVVQNNAYQLLPSDTAMTHRDAEISLSRKRKSGESTVPQFPQTREEVRKRWCPLPEQDSSSVTTDTSVEVSTSHSEGNTDFSAENVYERHLLSNAEKLLIVQVRNYFRRISSMEEVLVPHAFTLNTAKATGVTDRTVRFIAKDFEEGKLRRTCKRSRQSLYFDGFALATIKKVVLSFYVKKEFPTLKKILDALRASTDEDTCFPTKFGRETLRKVLHKMNFRYKRRNKRRGYYEQNAIIAQRREYLLQLRRYRNQKYNILWQDETWVNAHHTRERCWLWTEDFKTKTVLANTLGGLKVPSGVGRRIIVNHIGGEDGFVEGAEDIFIGETGGDYHSQMNILHFEEWFQHQLLPRVKDHTVIVVDNALYHNHRTPESRNPNTGWRKHEIQEWLTDHNIQYTSEMIKPQLLQLARLHKLEPKYVIDIMAENTGRDIKVLRLPVAHCELNPIELIWANLKNHLAAENKSFKINEVLQLVKDGFRKISANDWKKAIEHVKREYEDVYWRMDAMVDVQIQPLIIPIEDDEEEEETPTEEQNEDSSDESEDSDIEDDMSDEACDPDFN